MAESFQQNIDALFKGMEEFITTKTVVGEAIRVGDATILPLVDVSFGMMASSKCEPQKHNGGGGMGGKMSPSAILIIRGGTTKIVNVKNQDGVTKLLDLVPDLVNRFMPKTGEDEKVDEAVSEASRKTETFTE